MEVASGDADLRIPQLHRGGMRMRLSARGPTAAAAMLVTCLAPSSRRSKGGSCLGNASRAGCTSPTCSTAAVAVSRMNGRCSRMTREETTATVIAARAWTMIDAHRLQPPHRATVELAMHQMGMKFKGDALRLGPCMLGGAETKPAGPHGRLREFVGP